MTIVRAPRPAGNFTLIPNDTLRDASLSYRARGILAAILSRPDNWRTTTEDLADHGAEGRDAIRSAFTELEKAGYIRRIRRQGERGRWSTEIHVFDSPTDPNQPVAPTTDSQASETPEKPSPMPEKPTVGEPVANRRLNNKIPTQGGSNPQHAPARETPSEDETDDRIPPQRDLGGVRREAGDPAWRDDRCPTHQHDQSPPPCGACKDARLAVERAAAERVRADTAAHAEAEAAKRAGLRSAIRSCTLCDDRGYRGPTLCTHDPSLDDVRVRGATIARTRLRGGDE